MIDCHVHLLFQPASLQERLLTPPTLQAVLRRPQRPGTLDAGVTTVRDAGGTPQGFKMAIERGLIPGPRMKIAVAVLSQTGGHGDSTMPSGVRDRALSGGPGVARDTSSTARTRCARPCARLLRAGADFIKLHVDRRRPLAVRRARRTRSSRRRRSRSWSTRPRAAGKTCMAHAQGTQGIKNAVDAGVESIEHGIWLDDEVIDEMKQRGTFLVPTLVAPIWVLRNAEKAPGQRPAAVRPQDQGSDGATTRPASPAPIAAGVRIAMGTDSGVGPHGHNAEELAAHVECGMTPMQAIVAATKTASECIHMQTRSARSSPASSPTCSSSTATRSTISRSCRTRRASR